MALRIDEQRRKAGAGRSARGGEAEDVPVALIKAVYRPTSAGAHPFHSQPRTAMFKEPDSAQSASPN